MTTVPSIVSAALALTIGLTAGALQAAERQQYGDRGFDTGSLLMAQGNQRQEPNQRQQPNERRAPQSRNGGLRFNYTHLTLWSGSEELGEDGPEGDILRLEGALATGNAGYVFLNWQEADHEELGERSTRELGFGFQEQYSDRTSFFITVSYMQDRWDGDETLWQEGNMLRGRYGLRARPTDRIELDGAVVYTRGTGSTDMESLWSMDLGLSLYFTENIALRLATQDLDGIQPTQSVGLRVEFSP